MEVLRTAPSYKYQLIKELLPNTWEGVLEFLQMEHDCDLDWIDEKEIRSFKEYRLLDLADDYYRQYKISFDTAYDIMEKALEEVDRLQELTKSDNHVALTQVDYDEFIENRDLIGNEMFQKMDDVLN